jgi:hypothetical protein
MNAPGLATGSMGGLGRGSWGFERGGLLTGSAGRRQPAAGLADARAAPAIVAQVCRGGPS